MPAVDDGEQYEYGDVETHAIDADTSDFSPHQFIAPDEARDAMGSDDNEQDAANNDAARSKILSAEVFDSEDVPSPDNFLQIQKVAHHSKHMPAVDDGEQYEYGDVETHAIDADTSDFSPHQFIAPDEARDAMGSDDNEQDAANNDAARSKILSAEVFDSEDVPSPDNFLQISHRTKHMPAVDDGEQYEYGDVETHAIDADTSDFSPHQFIAPDEARDAMGSDDNEQDAANNDAARSKILSAEVFDSEDVPSPDNFLQISHRTKHMPAVDDGEQYEYGDVETHAIDADTSDFSPHQFIAPDEARDAMGSDDNEQDAANNDAARSKILSAEVFDSEDVPSPDNFLQISHGTKHMPAVDDGEQYEYGDVETHAIDADTSDFSPHQFIAPDEARDAMGSDDNEQDAANNDAARSKILSAEVFDSEDVPSPDNFLQKRSHA